MRKIVPNLRRDFKIFGPPGTGKTTYILERLKEYLDYGFAPEHLLLVGFARTTAIVLKERCEKELGLTPEQVKAIRTIHSLCLHEFPEPKPKLFGKPQQKQFRMLINIPVSEWPKANEFDAEEFADVEELGSSLVDKKLKLIQRARTTFSHGDSWKSIEHYYDNHDEQEYNNIHRQDLEHTYTLYNKYKKDNNRIDFEDMLCRVLKKDINFPKYNAVFVDECQDLNPLLWAVISKIREKCDDIHLAGDDDQSIFYFTSASPKDFLEWKVPPENEDVLDQSYRLPRKILDFSQRVIHNISPKYRKEKIFKPRVDPKTKQLVEGSIFQISDPMDLSQALQKKEDWIICSRGGKQILPWAQLCVRLGLVWKYNSSFQGMHKEISHSIKDNVLDIIKLWDTLKNDKPILGLDVYKLFPRISRPFFAVKKKEFEGDRHPGIEDSLSYTAKDFMAKGFFKPNLNFKNDWYKHIRFQDKDVYNPEIELLSKDKVKIMEDVEEVNKYIQRVWHRDPTFRADDIILSTIHAVKGKEATNVVVCDVWTYFFWKNYTEKTYAHRHEEIRVAYVGITRSKKRLFMWRPIPNAKKGEHSFDPLQINYYDYQKPAPRVPTAPYSEEKSWRSFQQNEKGLYGNSSHLFAGETNLEPLSTNEEEEDGHI